MRAVPQDIGTSRKLAVQVVVAVWQSSIAAIWSYLCSHYPNSLRLNALKLSSFECLAFKSKPPSTVLFLLIYRPPKPNSSFIPEMSNLLETLCTSSADVITLGDMNIHVDSSSCRFAAEFLQLLDCFNFKQLVDAPTHIRGHTLDLVITNSAPLTNLQVYDLGVSDHKVVSVELLSSLNLSKHKHNICFRNLKRINKGTLDSGLSAPFHTLLIARRSSGILQQPPQ